MSVPAVQVQIYDALTGEPAAMGAQGWVRDGAYVDSLRAGVWRSHDPASLYGFQAALDRAGTYEVVVEKAGYERWARRGVRVEPGRCRVETVVLRAELKPTK